MDDLVLPASPRTSRFHFGGAHLPARGFLACALSLALSANAGAAGTTAAVATERVTIVARAGAMGTDCERAVTLEPDRPLELSLPPGRAAWLRLRVRDAGDYLIRADVGAAATRDITVMPACGADARASPSAAQITSSGAIVRATRDNESRVVKLSYSGAASMLSVSATSVEVLSGRVTLDDGETPVPGVDLAAFAVNGRRQVAETRADSGGYYGIAIPWSAADGGYYLRTGEQWAPRALHEIWHDVPCIDAYPNTLSGCGTGTPLLTTLPPSNPRVDFSLDEGATLEGRVLDAVTGLPLSSAWIEIYASAGGRLRLLSTDDAGRYRATGFTTGAVLVRAWRYDYDGELHAGVPCPYEGCDLESGALVPVDLGQTRRLDFRLQPSSYIDVRPAVEGEPVEPRLGYFYLVKDDGQMVQYGAGMHDGRLGPLAPGDYYLHGQVAGQSFDAIYDGIECDPHCDLSQVRELGTAISISGPGQHRRIDMDFRRLPTLSGRVTDEHGQPIADATVTISRFAFHSWPHVRTGADGRYVVEGVYPGDYRVLVDAPGYVDQFYPAVDCETQAPVAICPGAATLAFSRTSGDRTADFSLRRGPRVTGRMSSLGLPWPSIWGWGGGIRLLRLDGSEVMETSGSFDDETGTYDLTDYLAGTYFLRAQASGFYYQVADGVNCSNLYFDSVCDLEHARPYQLGDADVEVDFDLVPVGRQVQLRSVAGAALPGIAIDVWNEDGYSLGAVFSDARGRALLSPYSEPIRISTDSVEGFVDQVYRDIPCPRGTSVFRGGCTLAGAAHLPAFSADPATPPIVFVLAQDPTLFRDGFGR
jgi:protocatechuate 3,4-dioxygenase beta subunit